MLKSIKSHSNPLKKLHKQTTMNAAQYITNGEDHNDIKFVTLPKPTIQPGYVSVKIHAASINPVDYKVFLSKKKGVWPMPLPFVPGYDFSGVVESVYDNSSGFNIGDEVFSVNWAVKSHGGDDHPIGGAFAEYIAIPATKLSHKPANVSHETAAALALVGTTALEVLIETNVTANTKVLVLGASGSVGTIAIQLAKLKGAHVVTTASSRSLEYAAQFGANEIINYNEKKWWLESETGHSNFDVIFDTVGEAQAFDHARTPGLVKQGGKFVSIANPEAGVDPNAHRPAFSYAAVFTMSNELPVQEELVRLVSEGKLVVPIEERFPFTQQGVWDIFAKIKSGKSQGKNVLTIVS